MKKVILISIIFLSCNEADLYKSEYNRYGLTDSRYLIKGGDTIIQIDSKVPPSGGAFVKTDIKGWSCDKIDTIFEINKALNKKYSSNYIDSVFLNYIVQKEYNRKVDISDIAKLWKQLNNAGLWTSSLEKEFNIKIDSFMDYYFYSLEGQNILRLDSCEKNYYIEKVNTIQKDKDPHVLYMAHNDFLEIGRYPYYKEEAPVFHYR